MPFFEFHVLSIRVHKRKITLTFPHNSHCSPAPRPTQVPTKTPKFSLLPATMDSTLKRKASDQPSKEAKVMRGTPSESLPSTMDSTLKRKASDQPSKEDNVMRKSDYAPVRIGLPYDNMDQDALDALTQIGGKDTLNFSIANSVFEITSEKNYKEILPVKLVEGQKVMSIFMGNKVLTDEQTNFSNVLNFVNSANYIRTLEASKSMKEAYKLWPSRSLQLFECVEIEGHPLRVPRLYHGIWHVDPYKVPIFPTDKYDPWEVQQALARYFGVSESDFFKENDDVWKRISDRFAYALDLLFAIDTKGNFKPEQGLQFRTEGKKTKYLEIVEKAMNFSKKV
jgi:hypothetical protein